MKNPKCSVFSSRKCRFKWSDRSVVSNFSRKLINLPKVDQLRNTESKRISTFMEKVNYEIVKLREHVALDRQEQGFGT